MHSSASSQQQHLQQTTTTPTTVQSQQPEQMRSTTTTPPSPPSMTEADRRIFEALDAREGGGAGNEIVDGQFEKGMTKNTRANQYRVI